MAAEFVPPPFTVDKPKETTYMKDINEILITIRGFMRDEMWFYWGIWFMVFMTAIIICLIFKVL